MEMKELEAVLHNDFERLVKIATLGHTADHGCGDGKGCPIYARVFLQAITSLARYESAVFAEQGLKGRWPLSAEWWTVNEGLDVDGAREEIKAFEESRRDSAG
jgi:hypothetical protein